MIACEYLAKMSRYAVKPGITRSLSLAWLWAVGLACEPAMADYQRLSAKAYWEQFDQRLAPSAPGSGQHASERSVIPVNFAPGNYDTPAPEDLAVLAARWSQENAQLSNVAVIGFSKSQSDLASESLALERAQVVGDALMALGVTETQLILSGLAQNHLIGVAAYPGAVVSFLLGATDAESFAPETSDVLEHRVWVPFASGEYQSVANRTSLITFVRPYLKAIEQVVVTGHSHSYKNHATQALAMKRANVVKEILRALGVPGDVIALRGVFSNDNVPGRPLRVGADVGVVLTALPQHINRPAHARQPLAAEPAANTSGSDQPVALVVAGVLPTTHPVPAAMYEVRIKVGSLRENYARIVADHGYTLGIWAFGDDDSDFDWVIPKGYSYTVEDDLVVILDSLQALYDICGAINELDKTVDLRAAVRGRSYDQ